MPHYTPTPLSEKLIYRIKLPTPDEALATRRYCATMGYTAREPKPRKPRVQRVQHQPPAVPPCPPSP